MDNDYYFAGGAVLIQGRAPMPAPRAILPADDLQGNSKSELRFLSFEERLQRCRAAATIDAHSKWLSLTDREWQDPGEWKLRLNMGARGLWSDCLDEASEQGFYTDEPESCRVALLYSCSPRSY
ncbi:MAG: hypothetical protein K1X75_14380 [Leptospirales bacterium]|nr:hypothetical protein [Leptospirales bacterium]